MEADTYIEVEYGTKQAASYLTMKAHENGHHDVKMSHLGVIELAGMIKHTRPSGENGPYKFKLGDLRDYANRAFPIKIRKSDIKLEPEIATPEVATPEIATPKSTKLEAAKKTLREAKKSLGEAIEDDPFAVASTLVIAGFLAGISTVIFLEKYLGSPKTDLLETIKDINPESPRGIELRNYAKYGGGAFDPVSKTVKLKFVKPDDLKNNSELKNVSNYNAGACKNSFEHGSTITIYAPRLGLDYMKKDNEAVQSFFTGAPITFDCDNSAGQLPVIWLNLEEFSNSFSLDSADVVQSGDIDAKVNISLQPKVLLNE